MLSKAQLTSPGIFYMAALGTIDALIAMPDAGAPKRLKNIQMAGLWCWSVRGFEVFRVYCLVQPDLVIVVRMLHGSRDIGAILEGQDLEPRSGF